MTTLEALRKRHKLADDVAVKELLAPVSVGMVDSDPYKFTARITTDAVDRQDEVVLPQGGAFGEFLSSGAIFWNHQYDSPVGYPDKSKSIVKGENFVEAGGVFMKRPDNWQGDFMPDFVREFVTQGIAAGINPGVSIGFIPLETRKPTKQDVARYGPDVKMVHSKWKLLEFSIAPVQANQEAVVTAVGKGLLRRELVKAIGIPLPDPLPQGDCIVKPIGTEHAVKFDQETNKWSFPRVQKCRIVLPKADKADYERMVMKELYRQFGRVYMPG